MNIKNPIRKTVVFGIILLFLGISVVSATTINIESTNIINDIKKPSRDTEIFYPTSDANIKLEVPNGNGGNSLVISVKNDYRATSGAWVEKIKLIAPDGCEYDAFGSSVSISGDTALIGADNNYPSGSAYVFRYNGISWVLEAKLKASDGAGLDNFGMSVSIDGDTAIIGANAGGINYTGSAYIFTRNGTSWTEEAILLAKDGEYRDFFGYSVSINDNFAVIGAVGDDDNGLDSGSAYTFKRDGVTWVEQQKLLASDGAAEDFFGKRVSIDGDKALIGAEYDDDNGYDSGSAYIFTRSGTVWTEEAKLTASDGTSRDRFGHSVSLDGDTALIGAGWSDDFGNNSGSAYIFIRNGKSWTQEDKLLASDGAEWDVFGVSVSIDGDTALIGACTKDYSGYAYVFTRNGTLWTEEAKLIPSDGEASDWFGSCVSIDGYTALIAAEGDDDNGFWSGSAYIFINTDTQPPSKPIITGPNSGKPNTEYDFTFNAIDPDGESVMYIIDWGDNNSEWTEYGDSGEEIMLIHNWSEKGEYTIKAMAKDINGAKSDWSEFEISIPRTRASSYLWYEWLLERFPLLERLLNLIR